MPTPHIHYVDGYFYRRVGGIRNGIDDLMFNTLKKIFDEEEISEWVKNSICACQSLLLRGIRYPNHMKDEHPGVARNLLHLWSLRFRKLFNKDLVFYRHQRRMTRDPHTLFIAVCVKFNMYDLIEDTPIPWYLANPFYGRTTWKWKRTILKEHRAIFVDRLEYYRSSADKIDYERRHPDLP